MLVLGRLLRQPPEDFQASLSQLGWKVKIKESADKTIESIEEKSLRAALRELPDFPYEHADEAVFRSWLSKQPVPNAPQNIYRQTRLRTGGYDTFNKLLHAAQRAAVLKTLTQSAQLFSSATIRKLAELKNANLRRTDATLVELPKGMRYVLMDELASLRPSTRKQLNTTEAARIFLSKYRALYGPRFRIVFKNLVRFGPEDVRGAMGLPAFVEWPKQRITVRPKKRRGPDSVFQSAKRKSQTRGLRIFWAGQSFNAGGFRPPSWRGHSRREEVFPGKTRDEKLVRTKRQAAQKRRAQAYHPVV
jgi:hypothetical protein